MPTVMICVKQKTLLLEQLFILRMPVKYVQKNQLRLDAVTLLGKINTAKMYINGLETMFMSTLPIRNIFSSEDFQYLGQRITS